MHIYPWQMNHPPPPPIKHRSLENQYTKIVSYIEQCIYTHCRLTHSPGQLRIDALNTATPNLADLLADLPHPHQLSIDALNTTTPNLADLLADLLPLNQA